VLIQKESQKAAEQLRKTKLTVSRPVPVLVHMKNGLRVKLTAEICFLMPPADQFNTGYLKAKTNDPL
jgi:hypothetical protein